jgi:GTP-binding protein
MTTSFIGSFERPDQCPPQTLPEYVFLGRSNVGKSSLINLLCLHSGLARTSGKPGKTQHFNYFLVEKSWYLVDVPGYGYAKRAQTLRAQWETTLRSYLVERLSLQCAFLLVDINVPPQKNDLAMARFLGESGIPLAVVFTKTDRGKPAENAQSRAAFEEAMLEEWETLPPFFATSAAEYLGREELMAYIHDINARFVPPA